MKNCAYALIFLAVLLPAPLLGQTDTVDVLDFFDPGGGEGTLNVAVQAKIDAGTLSNTVFRLKPWGLYVLTSTITVPGGKRLTLYAPEPGVTQETAPPMICWTAADGVTRTFSFDCYGDIYMKNIWLLYATTNTDGLGTQVGTEVRIDQDPTDSVNIGVFDNVIFDYCNIGGSSGGAVTVAASHARLHFTNSYFRNCTDTHFRYYGRAVSFPFGTQGWHIDTLTFENTTFANMGYVYMQEGAEYGDYVTFNHCTFLNTIQFTLESGWWHWLSVTNSIFVNCFMFGHIPSDGDIPNGGSVNIDSISAFTFSVPFTESERHILFANNSYFTEKWLVDYMKPYDAVTNPTGGNFYADSLAAAGDTAGIPVPQPMMSDKTLAFFNDNASWPYITLGTVYDSTNPGFLVPPTNIVGIKAFLLRKWRDNTDTTWAFDPNQDVNQRWPMNEVLRYSNATLKTAGMGGFPLGDLYRWWNNTPNYANWKAQAATENSMITTLLTNGAVGVEDDYPELPGGFELDQNYPNPFNPSTEIKYSVPERARVTLKVFNVLGMEIATLFNGVHDAGKYVATFDAAKLSSGTYFYRLEAGSVSITKKMVFMK